LGSLTQSRGTVGEARASALRRGVLNRAPAGLEAAFRNRLRDVFARDLPDVGILYIGLYRTLNLALDPHGSTFKPAVEASTNRLQ
jgi:hypothetical protein